MSITIALAGNPNSGKTTLFNALTGSNQYVGNWPGVTVEKKEGRLKSDKNVKIMDLPGIYSLSPYTLEEVVARNYLTDERPDVILNIVDGTNLERNLYLSTQLAELGVPMVIAVNMMDIVRKNGDKIDTKKLAELLKCEVVEISALRGDGVMDAAQVAVKRAGGAPAVPPHSFSGSVEHAIAHIEEAVLHDLPENRQRWYAIKLFERDTKIIDKLGVDAEKLKHIESDIKKCEDELDDDCESIITSERYAYIDSIIGKCVKHKQRGRLTTSDKIDKIVTNRILALPIFAVVMFIVYFISVSTVGTILTDWANDGVFGDGWYLLGIGRNAYDEAVDEYELALEELENAGYDLDAVDIALLPAEPDNADFGVWLPGVPVLVEHFLVKINCADWLQGLILDGIIGGVGAVLGFVPQILVLFILLAFLEGCGYMARIAFIMDRIFRKFGLSGKSFIPMLIGTGCGIPGIMASRTIENDRDRKMTIITTTFIPCGAKLPIIALIAGALFGGAWWVAPCAYFMGIAAIVCTGIILKKTKLFSGDVAPFVMELPAYHMPRVSYVLRSMWERGWSFIKRAGTVILLASVAVWFTSTYGIENSAFGAVEDIDNSILGIIGSAFSFIFKPLGFGTWQATVATFLGLVAKEEVVGAMGTMAAVAGDALELVEGGMFGEFSAFSTMFFGGSSIAAFAFMAFNLLCAPCFAAMGAIRREMNNAKWFWFAVGYQCVFAYIVALCINQLGLLFTGGGFGIGTIAAFILVAFFLYMLLRPAPKARLAA